MPKPHEGESHDEFIARCMADPGEIALRPDEPARYARCEGIWESERDMADDLITKLADRNGQEFGYGITTAKRYVVSVRDTMPSLLGDNADQAIEEASQKLVYASPDMVTEKAARDRFAELLPKSVKAPPHTLMIIRHVLTSSREDRDRDVLVTKGAKLDPRAPLLWQHLPAFPIGKVLSVVEHTKDRLVVVSALLDLNDMTRDIAKLVEADVLRFSHGFRPLEWVEREAEGAQREGVPTGYEIRQFEIMEASLVSVPSNVDAEVELWSRGELESEAMCSHAKSVFESRKVAVSVPESIGDEPTVNICERSAKYFDVPREHVEAATLEYDWVSRFIGVQVKDLFVLHSFVPRFWAGSVFVGLEETRPQQAELCDIRNLTSSGKEVPPIHESIQLNSERSQCFLSSGLQFWKNGREPYCVRVDETYGGYYLTAYSNSESVSTDLIGKAWQWAQDNCFMKGEAFSLRGTFIKRSQADWDELVLPERLASSVKAACDAINSKQQEMSSRGMIFMGPPGTGKTMTGRAMMNSTKATFIWVSAKDVSRYGSMGSLEEAFSLARSLSPAVIFCEDIDSALHERACELLKTEMDGIAKHAGILTVLTTNYPELLPESLIDRPGRFHDVLLFDLPDEAARIAMIKQWYGDGDWLEDESLLEMVDKTDGMSGAHIYELCRFALSLKDENAMSADEALRRAVETLRQQREIIGRRSLEFISKGFSGERTAPRAEKQGRVLSRSNLEVLEEVVADLQEIAEEEQLSRRGKTLCKQCITRLQSVIDKATPQDDEQDEDESGKDATFDEALATVLCSGKNGRDIAKALITAIERAEDSAELAKQYRALLNG